MVEYLLDSDYLINFLSGKREAVDLIRTLSKSHLSTSIICVAEVLEGLYAYNDQKKLSIFEAFLANLKVYGIDRQVAEGFAHLRADLRKKGKLIDNFDLLIAATAQANKLVLVTGNKAHFQRIAKLKIYKE